MSLSPFRSRAPRASSFALLLMALSAGAGAQQLSISNAIDEEPLNPPSTVSFFFTVSLSPASGQTVTVDWATADDSAVAGADYLAAGGTLTFIPGDTSEIIAVTVLGDLIDEPNERFFIDLSNPVNATISDDQGFGRIGDNGDFPPSMTIDDVAVSEGGIATFTLTLSLESGHVVDVNWATADGTATAPDDYAAASGSRTFLPGETTKTIAIQTATDSLSEGSETFFVNLTNPANATIPDSQGVGTIMDQQPAPTISVADATVAEGNAGTVSAVFNVTLSAPFGQTVTVDWATADQTAVAPGDYASTSGTVTFVAGDIAETVTVQVAGDSLDEPDETFLVNLTNPANATIADAQGTGTITDDDDAPAISIGDVTVTEGDAGTVNAVFGVTLSAASGQTVTADWATADGTATEPSDYAAASGTVTFVAGDTSETVTVVVNGDVLDEPDESFFVNLSNLVFATAGDVQGEGTIGDDESTLVAEALAVDSEAGAGSDGNGVLESGETAVVVSPSWRNSGASSVDVTGSAISLDGPAATYVIDDATADYGTIGAGAVESCAGATDDCYAVSVSAATRPVIHWDAELEEALSTGGGKTWALHVGESFGDVPRASGFYRFVETLLHNEVTAGCGGDNFCPGSEIPREQMAVFLLRGNDGPAYTPPACTSPVFADVPCTSPYASWINELSARGVTAGCGSGNYCPTDPVTREQMAVFLLRTLEGSSYIAPACTVPVFADVPCSSPYASWINDLAGRGITAGCGGGNYCPTVPVSREQMAVFVTVTFALTIYGP